jgi:type IV secretory pathway VirB10-like protein
MEQQPILTDTEVIEEKPAPAKSKRRFWLFAGLGGALLVFALIALVTAVRFKSSATQTPLTTEDLAQQKYDAQQKENERNKATALRNDFFLLRKEDADTTLQLNSLMSQLENNSDSPVVPLNSDKQVRAEEEAIHQVLRNRDDASTSAARSTPPDVYESRRPGYAAGSGASESRGVDQPMFIYSRTFGGAKYVDAPKEAAKMEVVAKPQNVAAAREVAARLPAVDSREKSRPTDQRTTLIYTEFPPVTLYEGEMIDAVLVNRIVADTEPSPVICQISKDLLDNSRRYVLFPANSRVVGLSQVVNYKGASRLFISFHRIILPNGPAVEFPSSQKALRALDETGALGVVSHVDRHWFLQFGTAIFFGVLDGLAGAAQRNTSIFSGTSLIIDRTSRNFERILDNIMLQYSSIVPTITVHQGKKMKIYLSEDLLISPFAEIKDRSYYANR